MGYWESNGASNEWYSPKYIFDALGENFDLDVANGAPGGGNVPCRDLISAGSLEVRWPPTAYIWRNPPFGGRNGIVPWLDKFFAHGHGIALTPDRTSATWWQDAARKADATLFIHGKVKFERPDGSVGKAPSNGTTLFAAGPRGVTALRRAAPTLGILMERTR
jgi:hypothetical protein